MMNFVVVVTAFCTRYKIKFPKKKKYYLLREEVTLRFDQGY